MNYIGATAWFISEKDSGVAHNEVVHYLYDKKLLKVSAHNYQGIDPDGQSFWYVTLLFPEGIKYEPYREVIQNIMNKYGGKGAIATSEMIDACVSQRENEIKQTQSEYGYTFTFNNLDGWYILGVFFDGDKASTTNTQIKEALAQHKKDIDLYHFRTHLFSQDENTGKATSGPWGVIAIGQKPSKIIQKEISTILLSSAQQLDYYPNEMLLQIMSQIFEIQN